MSPFPLLNCVLYLGEFVPPDGYAPWFEHLARHGHLFTNQAQDYFIVTRDAIPWRDPQVCVSLHNMNSLYSFASLLVLFSALIYFVLATQPHLTYCYPISFCYPFPISTFIVIGYS